MARSTYIYVVCDASGPIRAFTVKHEMVRWLIQYTDKTTLAIKRLGDGYCGRREPVTMTVEELLS